MKYNLNSTYCWQIIMSPFTLFKEMEICSVNTVILGNCNCMIPVVEKNYLPEENFSVVKTDLITS